MPFYTYRCPEHGDFDQSVRMDDRHNPVACKCGQTAPRREVYSPNVVMAGQSMPHPDDYGSIYDESQKELLKRGWDGGRATQEVRDNIFEDETGQKRLNRPNMTKSA